MNILNYINKYKFINIKMDISNFNDFCYKSDIKFDINKDNILGSGAEG